MNCKFKPTKYVHARKPEKRFWRCSRAECGQGVFLLPGQKAAKVPCRHPSLKAGDAFAAVASGLGFKKTPGCGCEKRQQMMNAFLPELGKPSWLSWWQGKKKGLPSASSLKIEPFGKMSALLSAFTRGFGLLMGKVRRIE
jgi:hypothetical protein